MIVFSVFLLAVAALGVGAYLAFFFSHVPGATEERLGAYEPLPEGLGEWREDEARTSEGLVRETRHLFQEATGFGAGTLVLQVRYRHAETREIVRVEPEQIVPRKRIRK